jgi:ribose transport system permease protein
MRSAKKGEALEVSNIPSWSLMRRFPQFSILIAFVILFVFLSVSTEAFFSVKNLINVLRQASTQMIVAIGMTFVLILGGIDLSVGSVACLSGTITAGMMVKNAIPTPFALLLGVLLGVLIGIINGVIIAKVKIPPFIVTLAMMSTARGAALIYSGGYPITNMPEDALFLGRGYIADIPVPVIIMIILVATAWVVLLMTKFGRHTYAIGGNEECARLSGIKVERTKIAVYAISGASAAITGILLTMRLASSQPTLGDGLELDAIAAVVLGGTSLFGGRGYVLGTILGTLFLTVLGNGLNILSINSFWQQFLKGIILVIAVSLYEKRKK